MKFKKQQNQSFVPSAILLGSAFIAIALLINAIVYITVSPKEKTPQSEKAYENMNYVKVDKSPTWGDKDAPITIIEYTDFDCPFCKAAYDNLLPELKKEFIETNKVKFIFKSLPIKMLHPTSSRKHEAALCARDQGGDTAFFAYHNSLFEQLDTSSDNLDTLLVGIAQTNGLNVQEFGSCLTNDTYKKAVERDIVEGEVIGSSGTPTWLIGKSTKDGIIDAVKINGFIEYSAFKIIINHLLEQ